MDLFYKLVYRVENYCTKLIIFLVVLRVQAFNPYQLPIINYIEQLLIVIIGSFLTDDDVL